MNIIDTMPCNWYLNVERTIRYRLFANVWNTNAQFKFAFLMKHLVQDFNKIRRFHKYRMNFD